MTAYEFECIDCGTFEEYFSPDEEKKAKCPKCGKKANRVWGFSGHRIDWVNGGWHGNEINLGLGKSFKSAREREYYAESRGLRKVKDG